MWLPVRKSPWVFVSVCCVCVFCGHHLCEFAMAVSSVGASARDLVQVLCVCVCVLCVCEDIVHELRKRPPVFLCVCFVCMLWEPGL